MGSNGLGIVECRRDERPPRAPIARRVRRTVGVATDSLATAATPRLRLRATFVTPTLPSPNPIPVPELPLAKPRRRLSRREWLAYGPFLAQLVVVRRCNLSCAYCFEYDKTSSQVPYRSIEERLEKLHDLRAWTVCLTGGEPTLHPDLVKIVAKTRDLGFRRRQMITNGYRLTCALVDELNEAGLTDLQLSLDGVRRTGTTSKVLDALRGRLETLARRARFRVVVNAVIGAAPQREALEVVEFAQAHGFAPRVLFVHDANGEVRLSANELAAYRDVKARLGRFGRDGGDYRERMIGGGTAPFRCRAGSRYLYVDERGGVSWCSQTRELFTKDLLDYDAADLRRQFHTEKPCNPRCAVGCARTASAFDEWRAQGFR